MLTWWQKAVFYQVYPRSFADSNGDGIGDLPGLLSRLEYLKDLGVDAIWLSPCYPSPLVDCGYDISDFTAIAPDYGTLADFQRFLDEAHSRGLRVILDLVLNHTSDQHAWFQESQSSRTNSKQDWYIWKDEVPNNWVSPFGGSAWEWCETRQQYYYHYFFKEQPDLNWRNPQVKAAMFNVMRFWLERGVDGFRLDAIGIIYEDESLTDHTAGYTPAELTKALRGASSEERPALEQLWREMFARQVDQPGLPELLRELRAVTDEFEERILVGETEEIAYCAPGMLHLAFNFPLMYTERLTPAWVRQNQAERLAGLAALNCPAPGAWPCNTLGNHDSPRVASRYGDGVHDNQLNRLWLALLLTLKGTPFLYNGEEIGMTDTLLTSLDQFRDSLGRWYYQQETELIGTPPKEAFELARRYTRDKSRTPMQWANRANAGFCPAGVTPWLPVNANYGYGVNVAEQIANPDSLLNFYRRLLRLRRQTPAIIEGNYEPIRTGAPGYLAFIRRLPTQAILVVLNMSNQGYTLNLADVFDPDRQPRPVTLRAIFSSRTSGERTDEVTRLAIGPYEIYFGEIVA